MGYILDNTNQFKVYLTDKGKELLSDGGLLANIAYFSMSDEDTNYTTLTDNFDPIDVDKQDIVSIENELFKVNGLSLVFVQPVLRGNIVNGTQKDDSLLYINNNGFKDVLLVDGEEVTEKKLLTYRDNNGYRKFKLTGNNGLYLHSPYPEVLTDFNELIKNYDFYPTNDKERTLFDLKNVSFSDNSTLKGNNRTSESNSSLISSNITKKSELILHERYYTEFNVYFNYWKGFGFDNSSPDYKTQVDFYASLGTNRIKLLLDGLQYYDPNSFTYTTIPTGLTSYIQLSGDTLMLDYSNTDSVVSLLNTVSPLAPNGCNFRVRCRLIDDIADFLTEDNVVTDSKDFKLEIVYSTTSDTISEAQQTLVNITNPLSNSGEPPIIIPDPS